MWVVATPKPVFSSPCAGVSGAAGHTSPATWCDTHGTSHEAIVIGGHDGCVRRLRASDGAVCWVVQCQAPVFAAPSIVDLGGATGATAAAAPPAQRPPPAPVVVWCTTGGRMYVASLASGASCFGTAADTWVPVGGADDAGGTSAQVFSSPVVAALPRRALHARPHATSGKYRSSGSDDMGCQPPMCVCWVGSRDDHVHAVSLRWTDGTQ